MDSVELVMEVEDHFKVTLPDSECSLVRTVADLAGLVISKLPRESGKCPTATRFFQVRDHVLETAGLPPRALRPKTKLEVVFPRRRRRAMWAMLRGRDPIIPRLVASPAVDQAFLWLSGVGLFAWLLASAATWGAAGGVAAVLMGMVALIAGGSLTAFAYSRLAVCFPEGCVTVGDLVRQTLPPQIPTERGRRLAAEQAVLQKVREIIAEQLGLKLDEVRPESRFIEDLRMD
ncbi:MAG: hypothetical protein IT437_11390 [Phycisphaerales bacterium]|nr:hypothetical protein [Phycisphaerales bacterium]